MQLLRQNIYHILLFIHILCSVQGKHYEPQWKWTLITERRNWHTITNMSRERENEKRPLHGEASTSTCLSLDKQSPGHVPCCYLRASALIRNPFAFHAQTEKRKERSEGFIITAEKEAIKIRPSLQNTAAQPHGLARHYSVALLSRRGAPLLLMALQTPDFNNAYPELI